MELSNRHIVEWWIGEKVKLGESSHRRIIESSNCGVVKFVELSNR